MTLRVLSKSEVISLESMVDTKFWNTPPPSMDLHTARWLLCTVGEDAHRFLLDQVSKKWHKTGSRQERGSFVHTLDRYKYCLRHALDLCARKTSLTTPQNFSTNEHNYPLAASLLLEAANDYADASRIFSSYHAGSYDLVTDTNTREVQVGEIGRRSQYNTLEFLIGADGDGFNPIIPLANIFAGPVVEIPESDSVGLWGKVVHDIVSRTKLSKGRIKYQFVVRAAKEVFSDFNITSTYLPAEWMFPWATAEESQLIFGALHTLCAYHLISIHFGAEKHHLKGGGVDQICLMLDKRRLIHELTCIAEVREQVVRNLVDAITYGIDTTTPDPALQPIIPVGDVQVAVPGIFILSSNWERNLLSLHARVDPKSFNANSKVFEKRMVADLSRSVPAHFPSWFNYWLSLGAQREEIDLLIADVQARSILLGELRWILQPGDVREVLNKRKVIYEKVAQAQRKLHSVRKHKVSVVSSLGFSSPESWTINAIVLIDGYGGIPSQLPKDIPVVPKALFLKALQEISSLERLHAFFTTPIWLPRDGIDFESSFVTSDVSGITFNKKVFRLGPTSYSDASFLRYIKEIDDFSTSDLYDLDWD